MLTIVLAASIIIQGPVDCGAWDAARRDRQSQYFEHYAVGFINGQAMSTRIDIWGRPTMSREQLYLYLDQFCRNNPLDIIENGMVKLAKERASR